MSDIAPATLTYGDHTFTVASLPPSTVHTLLRRGLTHFLGNEQASKVSTAKAKRAAEIAAAVTEGKPVPAEYSEEELATMRAEFDRAAVKAITEGTMSAPRASGPKADPIETIMRRIAVDQITLVLKAQQPPLSLPTGEKTVSLGGKSFTREALISARIASAKFGPAIRQAAEKELAARKRDAEKAAKASEGADLSEMLGLD